MNQLSSPSQNYGNFSHNCKHNVNGIGIMVRWSNLF